MARAATPVTRRDTRSEGVHCLRIGCSAPNHKSNCGNCETRAWLRRLWAAAGPGRASRSTPPSKARVWRSRGRAAAHRHTQRPGPTQQATRRPDNCRGSRPRGGPPPPAHTAARPNKTGPAAAGNLSGQQATPDDKSAKVHTHSAKTVGFECLSPHGSALWPQQRSRPRPRRHLAGELHYTRLRHAGDAPPAGFV